MPKLLAIDTSTEACSVALFIDGDLLENFTIIPRQHNEKILSMVKSILADGNVTLNHLDAIVFGRGPGAFTGLRIATAVVQGLAFAVDIPVIPISTLAAMAYGEHRQSGREYILTAIDARMSEIYWAGYQIKNNDCIVQVAECVCTPEKVTLPVMPDTQVREWVGVGTGWKYADKLSARVGHLVVDYFVDRFPKADDIVRLGVKAFEKKEIIAAELATPIYLRDNVVTVK